MNKNYQKGRRLEYKLIKGAKEAGLIAFRSAGSNSPVDVVIIDRVMKRIQFIQCKKAKYVNKKDYFEEVNRYEVEFKIYHENPDLRKEKK